MSEQWFTGPTLDLQVVDGNLRQTSMECTVTIMTPMFTGVMYVKPLRSRMARYGARGEVQATFYHRNFNPWNCRQGFLFLRKWRGNRHRCLLADVRRRRG